MQDEYKNSADDFVRDIDAMARAVFSWVRQQTLEQRFLGLSVSQDEERRLASGFIAGLRARLRLGDTESALVAYGYILMRGQRSEAFAAAQCLLLEDPGVTVSCAGYLHGLEAARRVLGETGVHDRRPESKSNNTRIVN